MQVPSSPSYYRESGPFARSPYAKPRFGSQPLYEGIFQGVKVITDYGGIKGQTEETSNHEIIDRFTNVLGFANQQRQPQEPTPQTLLGRMKQWMLRIWYKLSNMFSPQEELFGLKLAPWTAKKYPVGVLPIGSISDIPGGNADFVSLSLLRLGGMEKNRKLFIHVVDPGVGVDEDGGHDRTMMITRDHGVYIGANNGSLGMLYLRLLNEGDTPKLMLIDMNEVERLERKRLNDPQYKIPPTFHGRDVFAVIAGLIASGISPEALAERDEKGHVKNVKPEIRPFARMMKLPKRGETITAYALQDNTFGNLKLNIQLSDLEYSLLRQSGKKFQIRRPGSDEWISLPLLQRFNEVPKGEFLMYHGSSDGVLPGTRLLEIAANLDFAAQRLGIADEEAQPVEIRCV